MPSMMDPRDNVRTTQNLTMQQQFNKQTDEKAKEKETKEKARKKISNMLKNFKSHSKGINNAQQASVNAAGNESPGDSAKSAGNTAIGGVK